MVFIVLPMKTAKHTWQLRRRGKADSVTESTVCWYSTHIKNTHYSSPIHKQSETHKFAITECHNDFPPDTKFSGLILFYNSDLYRSVEIWWAFPLTHLLFSHMKVFHAKIAQMNTLMLPGPTRGMNSLTHFTAQWKCLNYQSSMYAPKYVWVSECH